MTRLAMSIGWAEAPLRRFVDDSRVQLAVLMHPTGQVLGQVGFKRSMDVQTVCALSSAMNASSDQLGRMLDGAPFRALHHAGTERQFFLGHLATPSGVLLLLAVFDAESSLGIVQLYVQELQVNVAAVVPDLKPVAPALADDFEGELNRNLAQLFGRVG